MASQDATGRKTDDFTWEKFEEELWGRFGPSSCEDFDEALSRIRHLGTLRDYQWVIRPQLVYYLIQSSDGSYQQNL